MKMKFKAFVITFAAALAFQGMPVNAQKVSQADFIVAVVNSEPITNSEVRASVARLEQQLKAQKQPLPPAVELRLGVLDRMINERAQLQAAAEAGIRIDDLAVDQAEENIARQSEMSVEEFRRRISKDGGNPKEFRVQLREQLILTRFREREVEARVRVSEQDIDKYVADEQAKIVDPLTQEINIAQILIAVPESAGKAQVDALSAKAVAVLERARGSEDFAVPVQEYSAADKSNGGQLGLRRGDRYPPLFLDATLNVPVGRVAEIVRSPAGFHILKVVERRGASNLTKTVVQSHARHILLRTSPQLSQSAALAQLADYRARIIAGKADFAALAREFSQDGSAAQGGDLGWASAGMFVPEFEDAMNRLRDGEIAPPMVSRFGVHLIQLLERRRTELNQREVRDSVRAILRESKLDEAYVSWAKDIRERAFVEMREPPL
jgi:peptidyl-prolyl cis-trans isomerase SurA